MRVAVIGSGIGGLLSANLLAESGYYVEVYEKLPFIGGRFTSINYKGYEVSTGALHMIPHGNRGPLGKLLKRLNANVEIVDSKPEGEIYYNGERVKLKKSLFPRKTLFKFYINVLLSKINDKSLLEFSKSIDEFSSKFLRSFLGWSFSIFPEDISFSKIIPIYKQILTYRGPGIPIGGCKAIINALKENIESFDGKILIKTRVKALKPGEQIRIFSNHVKDYDIVVSDIGRKLTYKLLGMEYESEVESRGIKYTIALNESFIEHTGVLFILGKNIAGMNEVTNADPNLGKRVMLQVHQPMRGDVKAEIEIGLREIREILKGYKYEIISIQSYYNDWPVNRVKTGLDIGNKTQFPNLVIVGDGAKGEDIEVDGIALGVMKALEGFI